MCFEIEKNLYRIYIYIVFKCTERPIQYLKKAVTAILLLRQLFNIGKMLLQIAVMLE